MMWTSYTLKWLAFTVLLLALVVAAWHNAGRRASHRNAPPVSADVHSSSSSAGGVPSLSAGREEPGRRPDAADVPLATGEDKTQVLESIHNAAVTYDPAHLTVIRKFLLHDDPEVRGAAINGMIVLGDSSAGAMLREAAKLAPTPHDAVAMLDAAEYMELPAGSLRSRKPKPAEGPHHQEPNDNGRGESR